MPGGRVVVAAIALFLMLAFMRAIANAWNRTRPIDQLILAAAPGSARLQVTALAMGVEALEVVSTDPLIFAGGIRRPIIFVSSGALSRLGDAELKAALVHERAHAQHGDQLLMAALLFFTDQLPLGVRQLTELYRESREFAADYAAIETADPIDACLCDPGRRVAPSYSACGQRSPMHA